ncbi:hypothetical protein BCT82_05485 [Vibrio breoganii]|uniref:hypothetical protein n=1 Tax=Vibrio breoganii TaxID=553239 RepID=UPI000C832CB8|nr:hypothetical protein [Vibrio breoganii]PML28915.1 hypothetical protein BCT82_05485 [Vibrio breoganii]
MTKKIHIFTSQKNYTNSAKDKSKLKISLAHSLRCISKMPIDSLEKIQWDDSLSHLNMLFKDGLATPLNQISEDQKISLIDKLIQPPIHDKRRKQTKRANYAKKIRKTIQTEIANGNQQAVNLLNQLLDHKPQQEIDFQAVLASMEGVFTSRHKQRLNMVEMYITAHNSLTTLEHAGSHTRYQEVVFKIPEKWGVTNDEFNAEQSFGLVRNFLKQLLPDHPILFATTHADENFIEGLTPHIHVFIDGKNARTKQFDLRARELESIDQYVHTNGLDVDDWITIKKKKDHNHSQGRGRFWQKIFLNATNAYFEYNSISLNAKRAEKTEDYEQQLKDMRRESKRPKAQRSHNYYSLQQEKSQILSKELLIKEQQVAEADKAVGKKLQQLSLIEQEFERASKVSEEAKQHNLNSESRQRQLAEKIQHQQATLDTLNMQTRRRQHEAESLKTKAEKEARSYETEVYKVKMAREELAKTTEQLKEVEHLQAQANPFQSVLELFVLIKDYFVEKKESSHKTGLFHAIIDGYKALRTKYERKAVYEYTKGHDQNSDNLELRKEMRTIDQNTPKLDKDKGL